MKYIIFILFIATPTLVIAQCDGIPKVYNLIQKESCWVNQENVTGYTPLIQYIGKAKDSIYVGIDSKIAEQLEQHRITDEFRSKYNFKAYGKGKFSIQVCSSNVIKMSFRKGDIKSLDRDILNCYSVIIRNVDSIPIDISIRKLRPIILEVEELEGKWRTVIEEYDYDCIYRDPNYFIKPNEIVILEVPINKTGKKYRVRIGTTYSNTFYQIHDEIK